METNDPSITVSALNLREKMPANYVIDRPWGLGCYLLLRFHSPMEIKMAGAQLHAEPGQCLFYSPEKPQWYGARDGGRDGDWTNDWMHLEGEEVGLLAARYKIPLNLLFRPHDTRFLPRLFDEIRQERVNTELGWEENVELLVRQLLLRLGRALHNRDERWTTAQLAHLPALRALRQELHDQLTRQWTVAEMAARTNLSPSRFAALYQQFFGVSPVEELLRARLQHAEYLLTNRAISVKEAAAQSGFRSLHYFSHVFHRRVGCPPSDYHQRQRPAPRTPP